MKQKWAINSAFMVFYAFAMTMLCWCVWAYKMGFGEQVSRTDIRAREEIMGRQERVVER